MTSSNREGKAQITNHERFRRVLDTTLVHQPTAYTMKSASTHRTGMYGAALHGRIDGFHIQR